MCGLVGIINRQYPANQDIFDALTVLQHRGQDAAGITTIQGRNFFMHKGNGLVRDVIRTKNMKDLVGNVGIGHVRYPTAGCASPLEAQPFYVNAPFGISLGHNGNLVNADELAEEIFQKDRRHLNTTSDSEILLNILAHELQQCNKIKLSGDDIFAAVTRLNKRCSGAYAAVALIADHGMIAFRDPYAIRPLIFGKRKTPFGTEYMVASESVALDSLGFEIIRDVLPGECIYFPFNSNEYEYKICADHTEYRPCIFELVYLARPDSILDKISVYKARLRMGEKLAKKILKKLKNHDIDVVIPIPDSGRTAAIEIAHKLNVKYREGFVKNRYIGRTFIMPGQEIRQKSIRQKLNAISLEFKDKNVLLVDDSIVRGNTSKKIIEMARNAGAKKVYFASTAPEVKYPNVYGIDMPSRNELIAHGLTEDEIGKFIGADGLFYQDLEDFIAACHEGNPKLDGFETSCFDGVYCTKNVKEEYLIHIEQVRNDATRTEREQRDMENPVSLL
ncbi:amidophosphoribosyltransferase [Candidatus Peregrinibacteria bacterium]|nr:amidophosphoribosyltransferase [Candidatus Peregrinibacteria bacterium]